MTNKKIKPMPAIWLFKNNLDARLVLYPESALAQAREEGRIKGMREAAEIVLNGRFVHDEAPTKIFAKEAAAAISRAAEGKK
jgi:hypothetical protein